MRLLRIGLVGIAVVPFLVAARSAAAPGPHPECAVPAGLVAPSLPAPLTVTTRCGVYGIARDGRVRLLSRDASPVSRRAFGYSPFTDVWEGTSHGHLVVGRRHRTLWRSHGLFRSRHALYDLSNVVLGPHSLVYSRGFPKQLLYVAPLGGRERLVARHEFPLGWTDGGFYTWGRPHHRLLLRGADGRFRATIAPSVDTYAYADRTLWLIRNGWLLHAEGAHVRRVAALRPLGLWPLRHLQLLPLGRLVGLEHGRRLVILHADGSPFASTALVWGAAAVDGVSAPPVANRAGSLVAFATTRGNSGYTSRGTETIWVLEHRDTEARPVRIERGLRWPTCVSGAELSWHGAWLLYSSNGGKVALINAWTGSEDDLTGLTRRLRGHHPSREGLDISVAWS